jgi:hypothetical protein
MPVLTEEREVRATWKRIEEIEDVAYTFAPTDDRRVRLFRVIRDELEHIPPVRPGIAARLLDLNEKTVRSWAREGVLFAVDQTKTAKTARRLLLDPTRLHEVFHLVRDLRATGKTRGLLDEVYRRLSDSALLDREDLAESLEQMRRGEGTVLIPRSSEEKTDQVDP